MTSDGEWTWQFRAPAKRTYDDLDALTGVPHSKLRIGAFRLGAVCDHEAKLLDVYTIEQRGSAYKPGDD
ncbi:MULTISPECIES: type II toxin-antitoxin system RelE/ParE family toxin [Halobacterium]|uniref:type II toxin-antitoxin system RelE family toxin n=1 Tax=Halobacterium TaxID=2239 RepID=UPI0009ECBC2E|nr:MULTISPECIES: hypothetical protein [Halobacterium]MCG1003395.1 hypothetical protein [Halobacterium noricense]